MSSVTKIFSFFYIQTLHSYSLHIDSVHIWYIFHPFLRGVEHKILQQLLFFKFKLCIMPVHTLKMCTSYFCTFDNILLYLLYFWEC